MLGRLVSSRGQWRVKRGQRQGCGWLPFSPLTVPPLTPQICFNYVHRVVLCCVDGGWVAWVSHIRKTGRLDLKVQVSVSIPWVWEDREGLGRETQGYVSRKVDPGVLLAGVGQRPTECQSWAVGAASGMGALYLKLYGPPVSLVCKFPERPRRPVPQRNRGRRNFCQGNTQARLLAHIVGLQEWAP